ncbi:helix-turn-helix transcriptional regulator [Methylomonas koyamae]|uniref:helix-turn-helix transcriptional regulator n=1 Tax=Methylomonas koyamae TaxID=702114 RepID=UPI0006D15655|nr:AlpA family phage regulatory protein [Methylomonas koyamae]BBL58501.1 hypothetical protein MKFW12EY_21140 [Methylomonas koyamae]
MATSSTQHISPDKPGFFRIWQIVGDPKRGIEPLIPIGRSTFLAGVREGKYPKPVKLGQKTTAWRKTDIQKLVDSFNQPQENGKSNGDEVGA